MSHSSKSPTTWLSLNLCLASCSLQMPSEDQIFARHDAQIGGAAGVEGSVPSSQAADGGSDPTNASATSRSAGGVSDGTAGRSTSSNSANSNQGGAGGTSASSGTGGFDANAGLVAHFTFDEASGTVAANSKDASKPGTYVGNCLHPTGRVGGAVSIRNISATSSTEWIELPAGLLSGLTATTLTIWVVDLSPTRDGGRLFHFSLGTSEEIYFSPTETDPKTSLVGAHLGGTHSGVGFVDLWSKNPDFTDKLWHHVALTWNAAVILLYIDGRKVGTKASPGVLPSDLGLTSPNWLGRTLNDKFIALYAQMDDLRIYNRVLSDSDIGQIYSLR